jgi:phosphoglycerate dehydrogenase-like enzyme
LKVIFITGVGNRSLGLEAAAARGIPVIHTAARPQQSPATAELAWGLLLSVIRDIPGQDRSLRAGRWQTYAGSAVNGKTLGLVGLGRLGKLMAGYGKLFGMEVLAWSQNLTNEAAAAAGAARVEKHELFARSDAVSIHLVLSERSTGLVGAAELQAMKPGAILINTSRGPIVDEDALVAALNGGNLRAGLDVFNEEPLPPGHRLMQCPNTVLTPHLGYSTRETFSGFYRDVVENLTAWLDGAPIRVLQPQT